ncbi:MAG: hypothetical protein ABI333_26560 [bacterium]
MADKKRTYTGITEDAFVCMKEGLLKRGAELPAGKSGDFMIKTHGFTFKFSFTWDGSDRLEVTCTDKPFVVGYGKIWETIDPGVESCGGKIS